MQAAPGQLLEVLNTAVILLDKSLRLTYLNPAAENLFEISRRQVLGQYSSRLPNASWKSRPPTVSVSLWTVP